MVRYEIHKKYSGNGAVCGGLAAGGAGDGAGVSDPVDRAAYPVHHYGGGRSDVDLVVVLAVLHRAIRVRRRQRGSMLFT